MANITPRLYSTNLTAADGVLFSASSEDIDHPKERIFDGRRTKIWQSKTGFTVVAEVNDRLDFTEGSAGPAQAILDPGTYATGADYAAEVETQMNLAATNNTYTWTYDAVTRKFTNDRATGSDTIELNWSTGPGSQKTCGEDLGFDVATDDTGATSYTSDTEVQQSVQWLSFDLESSQAAEAAVVLESNLSASGVITVEADSVGTFLAPDFSTTLSSGDPRDATKYLDFFSEETHRYWRVKFEDRDNADGFIRAGVAWIGPKVEFARVYDLNLLEEHEQLSEITVADQGAVFTDIKPGRRRWGFQFKDTDADDKEKWETLADDKAIGEHFFYSRDPLNRPLIHTIYGFTRAPGVGFQHLRTFTEPAAAPVESWTITFPFSEAIG